MGTTPVQAAILIQGGTAEANFRFMNDAQFIGGGFNLSGIARSPSNTWGTLVGPSVFLSANHYRPGIGQTLVFYEGNDPTGPSVTRTVVAGQRLGSSDVWAGILDSPVPSNIHPLPVYTLPIASETAFSTSPLAGLEVFMVGRSDDINASTTNMAFGRNVLDRWWTDHDSSGAAIGATFDTRPNKAVDYEAILRTYDSGAPVLGVIDGVLTILGFNWFIAESTFVSYSGFSYVGNQASAVDSLLQSFASGPSSGYTSWMASAFPVAASLSLKGPNVDFDGDGLSNFSEYALFSDPTSPVRQDPLAAASVLVDDLTYLGASFLARADASVSYTCLIGPSLTSLTPVSIVFSAGAWSSARTDLLVVHEAVDLGNDNWSLLLRSASASSPAAPRFILLQVP